MVDRYLQQFLTEVGAGDVGGRDKGETQHFVVTGEDVVKQTFDAGGVAVLEQQ